MIKTIIGKPFREIEAKDIMDENFVYALENESMESAMRKLINHELSGMPVLNKDKLLVGFISEKDALRFVLNIENYHIPISYVSEYMQEKMYSFNAFEHFDRIIEIFIKTNFHSFPVEQSGTCIGLITRKKILEISYRLKIEDHNEN